MTLYVYGAKNPGDRVILNGVGEVTIETFLVSVIGVDPNGVPWSTLVHPEALSELPQPASTRTGLRPSEPDEEIPF